jgi:hypothetical protein
MVDVVSVTSALRIYTAGEAVNRLSDYRVSERYAHPQPRAYSSTQIISSSSLICHAIHQCCLVERLAAL